MIAAGHARPHRTPRSGPWRRWALRTVRRASIAGVAVSVVVAAVPPLRQAALYGATAAVLRGAGRWAPAVGPFAGLATDTRIVAADGRLLDTLQAENRRPLRLADVPVPVRRAVLAAEDKGFYRHAGVDPLALGRAAWRNLGDGLQGGSTITQQLAKTNFTTGARTFDRKVDEALIAGELERRFTKDELLERYLNQVYFGERAYGLAAAAHTFFGVDPAGLSVAQAAMLAGKIQAPERLDPRADPGPVLRRRNVVLANMAENGWLTDRQLADARAEPLTLAPPRPPAAPALAPHFVDFVKREAQTLGVLGGDAATRLARLTVGGYRVEMKAGFRSVHAVPMRLRGETIGALNLFQADEGELDEADVVAARALADIATIGILQHRAAREAHIVIDQLDHALQSRIAIEQAKGVIAERSHLDMDQAFAWLRHQARSKNRLLVDVAQAVIDGTVTPDPPRPVHHA